MGKTYRIHPAIGIGRVGNSDDFFLASEIPNGHPIDINLETHTEQPLSSYKENGKIRKQGVRFRIWEHEETSDGLMSIREITLNEADIEWRVKLGNKKAAHERLRGPQNRNESITDQNSLELTAEFPPIAGASKSVSQTNVSKFLDQKEVLLGQLKTDSQGRLIVIGGSGVSERVPHQPNEQMDFADNDAWFDDTSDGSIEATIKIHGESTPRNLSPSWIIIAPPDYAPEVKAVSTLYDVAKSVAVNEGLASIPAEISFYRDVRPLFSKTRTLGRVVPENTMKAFNLVPDDMQKLSDNGDENYDYREDSLEKLETAYKIARDFVLPDHLGNILDEWVDGNFLDDFSGPHPVQTDITPSGLDRVALDQTVGGGFFPGIEAGKWMQERSDIYAFEIVDGELSPRLSPQSLSVSNLGRTVSGPGYMTAGMAVPWQADFLKCGGYGGRLWWPAQRPDSALTNMDDSSSRVPWIDYDSETVHQDLIAKFPGLAIVREVTNSAGDTVFIETERDDSLPRNLVDLP